MTQSSPPNLEAGIAEAMARRDWEGAASQVLRGYGPDILGYLVGRLRDEGLAAEAFAMFAEDLWRALPGLAIAVSMRAYAYSLARHAASRLLDRQVRKDRKAVPLSDAGVWSQVAQQVRSATLPHLRTEVKTEIQRLREQLTEEEQTLLTLRVDRNLSWQEIAVALSEGKVGDADFLKRESARLRKRFELTKDKLRKLAMDAGLLPKETEG